MHLLLFFSLLAAYLLAFGLLHVIALRLVDSRRMLVFMVVVYLASALVVWLAASWTLAPLLASRDLFVVANAGAATAGFFAAGLYSFLGPVTADRSFAAQMLVRVTDDGRWDSFAAGDIASSFDRDTFVRKRVDEFVQAGLASEKNGRVTLAPSGVRLARCYSMMLTALRLTHRSQYVSYFSSEKQ